MKSERWGLQYQAWRIARIQSLLKHHSRKEALSIVAGEEVSRPWTEWEPLPAISAGHTLGRLHNDGAPPFPCYRRWVSPEK